MANLNPMASKGPGPTRGDLRGSGFEEGTVTAELAAGLATRRRRPDPSSGLAVEACFAVAALDLPLLTALRTLAETTVHAVVAGLADLIRDNVSLSAAIAIAFNDQIAS